ncbi:MAG: DUF3572 domain-containing protein [Litoreibacter sp.]
MNKDMSEALALEALEWIASTDDLMGVFLGASGASAGDIRASAQDPTFLGSVLDFLLMDDDWVRQFCDAKRHDYQKPMIARQHLPGGDIPNWT